MRSWTLAFFLGVLAFQYCRLQFTVRWVGFIILVVMLLQCRRFFRLPCAFVIGFILCLWYADVQSSWTLPSSLEGATIPITGYVASIPHGTGLGTAFLFSLRQVNHKKASGLLQLTSTVNLPFHVGDEWQLYVRLKKIHSTMNPGGFDYEAFAFQEGVRAHGYVRVGHNICLASHGYRYAIDRMRSALEEKIEKNLPRTQTSPWIIALTVGERHDATSDDWDVLRNTGTNHLMAIAGLHIGCMAALVNLLVIGIFRRVPRFMLIMPAQHAGAIAALFMAVLYSALAGFSIPTQRASFMLSFFLIALLLRRHIAAWQGWSMALLVVLICNPLTTLTTSFWLSFGSVAFIIYGVSGRLSPAGLWWKYGRIQWVIAIGLLPLSMWLFQQCSLVAFAANCIAIPWVAFVVVPLCLVGCLVLLFSPYLGGCMLSLADKILSVLWSILTWFSHLPHVVWYQAVPHGWMLFSAVIGVIFLLLPRGFPGRYFSVIWLLPVILYKAPVPSAGEAWFTLLDVGQGLSAVVQTAHHLMVFDAGPRLSASYDMGESVVVPFLHSIAAKRVDMLVISHADNDHIGGANAIRKQFPVLSTKTSVPALLPDATYCLRDTAWDWDGVHFAFLSPGKEMLDLDNNSSCVLRVTVGDKHILLTGDIEKLAEEELVKHANVRSDILIAPHHGSKTSANPDFIEAVHPQYVLFPIGYRNRYHFPHPSVIAKYQALHVTFHDTVEAGAIQFKLKSNEPISPPVLYRKTVSTTKLLTFAGL